MPDRFSVPFGKGISGACAASGEIMNVRDAASDERTASQFAKSSGYAMKNTLCAPIIDHNVTGPKRILGVIQLLNKTTRPGYFSSADESALTAFCNIVALAMRNAMVRFFCEPIITPCNTQRCSLNAGAWCFRRLSMFCARKMLNVR